MVGVVQAPSPRQRASTQFTYRLWQFRHNGRSCFITRRTLPLCADAADARCTLPIITRDSVTTNSGIMLRHAMCIISALLLLFVCAAVGGSVVFQDPKGCPTTSTARVNTVAPFFGTEKLDLSMIKDTIKTNLIRFDDSRYNNTALCLARLNVPCWDEMTLEVFANAFVQITVRRCSLVNTNTNYT